MPVYSPAKVFFQRKQGFPYEKPPLKNAREKETFCCWFCNVRSAGHADRFLAQVFVLASLRIGVLAPICQCHLTGVGVVFL